MSEYTDIEVNRISPESIEMLDQPGIVCKRYGVNYYSAPQNTRDLLDAIVMREYQPQKAHKQGLTRKAVPPFMGIKRSERSNDRPA